ncbi:MAG: hypothetical protein AAF389_10535 [Gemmatimonadota bacterium]
MKSNGLRRGRREGSTLALLGALAIAGCGGSAPTMSMSTAAPMGEPLPLSVEAPSPDPRVGLGAGLFDAEQAIWNMELVSETPPQREFVGKTNSDLAFSGNYAIQGNYDGVQVWDVSDPANPTSVVTYVCPASQSDVSVYGNLLFVSGEGLSGRLDCSNEGVQDAVSHHRLRGIRIFDISDIRNPEYVANVQTCRGSHTHTVVEDPSDDENVYIYVSGSAPVRPADELEGCSSLLPEEDPNSALFRIEVIQVPLADPAQAAIVSSPRIFNDLVAPPTHGLAPEDQRLIDEAVESGAFVADFGGQVMVLPDNFVAAQLAQIVQQRGGSGAPTAADSTAFRDFIPTMVEQMMGGNAALAERGPTQCHDITVYPHIGLAGGACEGYGLLLDISDVANPVRIDAVSDENFAYWHSATFNNDGSSVVFTDEWGGGGGPKCRDSDPYEWGANAIFTVADGDMDFRTYYKLPAPQTSLENCVAHNGSLIPVPGRDIMIQAWYQGGISLFDFTDVDNPVEIAFHDRGPVNPDQMGNGGSWSVYWYNGLIVSSEIARGLDIFELVPSDVLTQNEIDAANSVVLDELNSQGQPIFEWPATFALSRAYLDQLERHRSMNESAINAMRAALDQAEAASGQERRRIIGAAARALSEVPSSDSDKAGDLLESLRRLGAAGE